LAAGCTMVLKPSEFTPLSAMIFADILNQAGMPPGVLNLINGTGPVVGQAICSHSDVDLISFTGSTRAGALVARAAAATIKRLAQELGGKSASIVLRDADLDAAVKWNVNRCFQNSGQSCHAPSRMLVHVSQVSEVVRSLKAYIKTSVRIGDPSDPTTTMGPVVNDAQLKQIQRYIQSGLDQGARIVSGGLGRTEPFDVGYFVKPTVFTDVTPTMTIAQEEIFGPVLAVMSYTDEDEAVEIANDSKYGLGAYVFSGKLTRALGIASRLRAGRVFLNGAPGNSVAPMGGYKQTGNGRELGVFGLEEYLETKAIMSH
jgi:aldehyde dehydrogenase (NAD+)